MGTPAIAVPTIVSQPTAYVPQQPIVVPISPPVFVQTAQPVIRTIPSQIIVSSIMRHISENHSVKKDSVYKNFRNQFKVFSFRQCVIAKSNIGVHTHLCG
jgi:hypothetical protein